MLVKLRLTYWYQTRNGHTGKRVCGEGKKKKKKKREKRKRKGKRKRKRGGIVAMYRDQTKPKQARPDQTSLYIIIQTDKKPISSAPLICGSRHHVIRWDFFLFLNLCEVSLGIHALWCTVLCDINYDNVATSTDTSTALVRHR